MSDQQPLDQPPTPKPNNRRNILIIVALGLFFTCAACGLISLFLPDSNRAPETSQQATDAPADETTEPPTNETAEQPTDLPSDEPQLTDEPVPTPTNPPAPTATPQPTSTPEPEFDTTIYVAGSNIAPDDIPQGEPGLNVVLAGPPSSFGVVSVVIRNNTDDPVYDIDFSATARDSAGTVLGTGSGDDIVPAYVPPGGLAIGRLLMGDTPLDGATIDYLITADDEPGFIFTRRDLELLEHNLVGGNVVGLSRNNHDSALDTTKVVVMCFNDDLIPTTVRFNFTDQDRVEAGADLPFSVDLLGDDAQCGRYLLAGSGRETD